MKKIFIILFLLSINYLIADTKTAYLNIISNVEDTSIFMNGKNIGKAPISQYEVTANTPLYLEAIVDTDYYRQNIKKTLQVNNQTIPTFNLKFKKAKAKIFFVGVDAELYINDTFVKKLNDTNRVVVVESGKNIKIKLLKNDSEIVYYKDMKAKTLNTLQYSLVTTPKEVRLYTSTINNLMWEDTKDAANTNINWEKASLYCDNLKFAQYEDFRLPMIEELEELYQNKDKIYNGFGGIFYWSGTTFKDDHKIWDYSIVKNFEDGTNKKSIKEFAQGRVRCVRDITEE